MATTYSASQISFTLVPQPKTLTNLRDNTVQAALEKLDEEKLSRIGNVSMTGNLDMSGNRILNMGRDITIGNVRVDTQGDLVSSSGGNSFFIRTTSAANSSGPTYSFQNNPDTGMWADTGGGIGFSVNGTNKIVLERTREINVKSNRITNLSDPQAGTDAATKDYVDGSGIEKVLGVRKGINLLVNPNPLSIYSVPTGKNHIITKIIIRLSRYTVGANPVDPKISIGVNSSNYDNILQNTSIGFGGISAAADFALNLNPNRRAATPNTGDEIFVNIESPGVRFSAYEVDIYILGIEVA